MRIVNQSSIDDVLLIKKLETAIGRTIAELTEDELKLIKWKFYDKDERRFVDIFYVRSVERRLGRKLTRIEIIQEEILNGVELLFPDGRREVVVFPRIHVPYDLLSKVGIQVERNSKETGYGLGLNDYEDSL